MKEKILDYYLNSPNVRKLKDLLDANVHISCLGLIGSSRAYVVAAVSEIEGGHSFVICGDKEKAAYFYNDLENIYGEKDADYSKKRVLFYPTSYKRPYEPEKPDNTYILSRTEVLQRVTSSERRTIIVTYPEALSEKVITRKVMTKNTYKISVGNNVSMDSLAGTLCDFNFEHVDFVVEPGQFSIRGGIVDVFSFSNDYPYRIEFFGDEIDSIRSFNPVDQLSIEKLHDIIIIPNLQDYGNVDCERETILQFLKNKSTIWIEEESSLEEKIDKEYDKACDIFAGQQIKDSRQQTTSAAVRNFEDPELIFTKGEDVVSQLESFKTISFGNFCKKR